MFLVRWKYFFASFCIFFNSTPGYRVAAAKRESAVICYNKFSLKCDILLGLFCIFSSLSFLLFLFNVVKSQKNPFFIYFSSILNSYFSFKSLAYKFNSRLVFKRVSRHAAQKATKMRKMTRNFPPPTHRSNFSVFRFPSHNEFSLGNCFHKKALLFLFFSWCALY